jgi:uncharacterized protein YcgI (DUF1989 family)
MPPKRLVTETRIPGGYARAFGEKGQLLQIMDVEGQQVAH